MSGFFTLSSQTFDPHLTGPYEPVDGRFFIRVFLVYVETTGNPWATNLGSTELERRTARSFEVLNSAFNKHAIYFTPKDDQTTVCYTVHSGINPPSDGESITVHVYSDEDTFGGTTGNSLPTKVMELRGSEDGIPASNLPILVHEMGHCLGLAHTFAFTELDPITSEAVYSGPTSSCDVSEQECVSSSSANPEHCCGDMISDTPMYESDGGSGISVELNEDCCCPDPPNDEIPLEILTNYMTYSHPARCRNHFTGEQVLRMREYLATSSVLADVLVEPEIPGSSATWNSAQTIFTNIEIEDGVTLTIDATLTMMPGAYIIVRRGGTLVVNATITAGCGGMWGGIVVEGNGEQPQSTSTGGYSPYQGKMFLNADGVVEHAVHGIGVHAFDDEDNYDFCGGIVEIRGDLRNCTRSLAFRRYRHAGAPNRSFVSQGLFLLDDDYRGVENPQKPVFLQIMDINRMAINHTIFNDYCSDEYVGQSLRADGLIAEESAFRMYNCYLHNLDHGVSAHSLDELGGYGSYELRNSNFYNCFTGVYTSLPDVFSITGNNFQVGRPPDSPVIPANNLLKGVELAGMDTPTGILVENNNFFAGNKEPEEEFLVGTSCLGIGNNENFIRLNEYEELDFANYAAGTNGGATGLRYECNTNTNNPFADFYVEGGGSVRRVQGDVDDQNFSTAAGNEFNGSVFAWWNDGTAITYYYDDEYSEQDPTGLEGGTEGIDEQPATQPNPNCGTPGEGCPPPCDPEEVESWEGDFYQERSYWFDKLEEYANTFDPEEQEQLAREIAAHRSAMDLAAGKLIRHYALDSTGVKADSVLAWHERLYTFETDLRLARHYFFRRDFSAYDDWLEDIPERNELNEAQETELDKFAAMLAVVRPSLEEDDLPLHRLPGAVLDDLEAWASDCNEPGFVAQEILRRNGRRVKSECFTGPSERPGAGAETTSGGNLQKVRVRIYPNPVQESLYVEVPQQMGRLQLMLVAPEGRTMLQTAVPRSGKIDVSRLPAGLYFCRIMGAGGYVQYEKIVISH